MARKRTHGSPWTSAELQTLRSSWGEVGARVLRRRLGAHSWTAIRLKAKAIGLPARPQGHVSVSQLAARCGCEFKTIKKVLDWAGVPIMHSYPAPKPYPFRARAQKWYFVDEHDGIEAYERWLRAERTAEAATRLGVSRGLLWSRAHAAGLLTPRRGARLAPEVWDQLAARPLWSREARSC